MTVFRRNRGCNILPFFSLPPFHLQTPNTNTTLRITLIVKVVNRNGWSGKWFRADYYAVGKILEIKLDTAENFPGISHEQHLLQDVSFLVKIWKTFPLERQVDPDFEKKLPLLMPTNVFCGSDRGHAHSTERTCHAVHRSAPEMSSHARTAVKESFST